MVVNQPKSQDSIRSIPISKNGMQILTDVKTWQEKQKEKLGDTWDHTDNRVFTTDNGNPMYGNAISTWLRRFIVANNLSHITFHGLRHTYASILNNAGVPINFISHWLGHASIEVTLNNYGHIFTMSNRLPVYATAKLRQYIPRFTSNDIFLSDKTPVDITGD